MSGLGWKSGRRWRHVTLNAKSNCRMVPTLTRLLNTMKAMKSGVIVFAGINKTHVHLVYRGFYLHQRSWSEIFKICSMGSYIAYCTEVKDEVHLGNVVAYIMRQCRTHRFINWPQTVVLEQYL